MNIDQLNEAKCWEAVVGRSKTEDGRFFYAVKTTGVYCRPSCASRLPKRENVEFFGNAEQAQQAGYRPCKRCQGAEKTWVERVCRHIENHLDEAQTLEILGEVAGLSPAHLQRQFKAALGVSPREYADACRLRRLKVELRTGQSVTEAMYDAGYGSTSRLYERTDAQLGMSPTAYRKGGEGERIKFLTAQTRFGWMLVAGTERGLCGLMFGEEGKALEADLRKEYPRAMIERSDSALDGWVAAVVAHLDGREARLDLPVDVKATAFQRKVWSYLQSIPYGTTRSYAEVAEAIGEPKAVRAVARACASNRVALVIPCHRVIQSGGGLGGYRWGVERKERFLAQERSA